ncbi:MAG: DUF4375 domain-containing protein [Kofleriaceae bacterium]|nr:DUF4375 domain-containing protein [Kofleriaceae bacterium]
MTIVAAAMPQSHSELSLSTFLRYCPSETPAAFDKIGAHKVAKLALEANALFGPGGPPIESEQRRDALDALDGDGTDVFGKLDESFYSYPDDIAGLLSTYLNQSR